MLDRFAERVAQVVLGRRGELPQQRVADVASGGRGEAQEALRRRVEPGDALQQKVAQATWELALPIVVGGSARSSSAKNGLPSERATIVSVSAADGGASA